MDPDFFRDYPPLTPIKFGVPSGSMRIYASYVNIQLFYTVLWELLHFTGYKVVMVQDFTKEQMPLLLQRAKIVLDLGIHVFCFFVVCAFCSSIVV